MMLLSRAPATVLSWQPRPGQVACVVVVKATFTLELGILKLAAEQEHLHEEDHRWNDDPGQVLVRASDLVPPKRRVDVLYVGRVPPGTPPGAKARFVVGALDKTTEAFEDRWPGLGPVGLDERGAPSAIAWARAFRASPMPDNVSPAIFNVAPPDQQIDELRPDAEIRLEHLAPAKRTLRAQLPGVEPRVEVQTPSGSRSVAMRADTILIDGDRGLVLVTWRGQLVGVEPSELSRTLVELDGLPPPTSAPEPAPRVRGQTVLTSGASVREALPFRAGAPGMAPPGPVPSWTASAASSPKSGQTYVPRLAGPQPVPSAPSFGPASSFSAAAPAPPPVIPPPSVAPAVVPPPITPAVVPPPITPLIASGSVVPAHAVRPTPSGLGPSGSATPPPPGPVHHAAHAVHGGVIAASDAAADPSPSPGGARAQAPRRSTGVRLLWHDTDSVLRVRSQPEHKVLLAQRERRAPARSGPEPSADAEDAGEMAAILIDAVPAREAAVGDALARGLDDEGRFEPAILVLHGTLALELDERAHLAALVAVATPAASKDEALARVLAVARDFLSASAQLSPSSMAASLADSVREAWSAGKDRPFDGVRLDELASRAALEQRAFKKRDLLGGVHVRAALVLEDGEAKLPTYLPEDAAKKLPLYLRLPVRAIVEVHPREDETETHGASLRVLVLGRVI